LVIPPPEKKIQSWRGSWRPAGWLVGPCPWLIWSDIRGSPASAEDWILIQVSCYKDHGLGAAAG